MYAICGVGNWGLKLLKEFSKYKKIKYFCCKSDEKAKSIIEAFPDLKRASLEEICSDKDVSDVIVAVPISSLEHFCKKLIKHNKNIFLEKPGATTFAGIKNLMQLESSSLVCLNYKFLFNEKIKSLKDSNEKIVRFNFEWSKYGSFNNDIRLNLLCHPISILNYVFPSENFYMEYSALEDDYLLVKCFSENMRGKIRINRKCRKREFYLALETQDKKYRKIDLNSPHIFEKSIKNFVDKTNKEFGLQFASKVLKDLENIR